MRQPSLGFLLRLAAAANRVSVEDLKSKKRRRPIAWPRQEFVMLARDHTDHSFPEIARHVGRDHTTAIYANRQARARLARCLETQRRVEAIKKRLEMDMALPMFRSSRTTA